MFHVYILASRRHGTLYIGVTNSLQKRLEQHRHGDGSSFVKAYGVYRLVYVESYDRPVEAIAREKQLKLWKRDWKIELIERDNLEWRDLSDLIVDCCDRNFSLWLWVPACAGTTACRGLVAGPIQTAVGIVRDGPSFKPQTHCRPCE